ncbi:MAG: alpha/beta hydrolase [Nanoarchaeota archaeon]|nr:alpha/beta hydrolase [Nanoarchaeota archaeon]
MLELNRLELDNGVRSRFLKTQAINPKGTIIFSHGYFIGPVPYRNLLNKLSEIGYDTFALDNGGDGDYSTISESINASRLFIEKIAKEQQRHEETYLLGHSLGGLHSLMLSDNSVALDINKTMVFAPKIPVNQVIRYEQVLCSSQFLNSLPSRQFQLMSLLYNPFEWQRQLKMYSFLNSVNDFNEQIKLKNPTQIITFEKDEFGIVLNSLKEWSEKNNCKLDDIKGVGHDHIIENQDLAHLIDNFFMNS